MKNKKKFLKIFIFIFFQLSFVNAQEEFSFDIGEIEITNNGNLIKGLKRGTVKTNDSKILITADLFEYDKIKNILIANGNVLIVDQLKDYKINSNYISYFKKEEKIFSKGKTKIFVESKYKINSTDIYLDRFKNIIETNKFTRIIDDELNEYETDTFSYSLDKKIFKGKNVTFYSNLDKGSDDKEVYNFKDGIFDLVKKDFISSDIKIFFKKNIFNDTENDPRIYGNSSKKEGNKTEINKAIFTTCKLTGDCPPWSIKASKITHDKDRQDIIYKDSILQFYEFPIFYFPKFIHADPTTKRRSGFLQPLINGSKNTGSSLTIPYFHVISETDDLTLRPSIFDSDIYMFQAEYRKKMNNSNLLTDVGLTKGYQEGGGARNHIGHLFAKFTSNLDLDNFTKSDLNLSIQKITKDTYLKIFDSNLGGVSKKIKPQDQNKLESSINLQLENENFNLSTGFISFENLNGLNSDRYQHVLPYYTFSRNLYKNSLFNLNFSSDGSNNLKETNKLESLINNNFDLTSKDFFSKLGFKNNINIHFKNSNALGKNIETKKSSPAIDLQNIINLETSLPLLKYSKNSINSLTPKLSLRINPTDMNDASNEDRTISVDNIFDINRLGLNDLEQGKSLTLGVDYKKESINDINKYFELKFAGVLRDVDQKNIPSKSSINQKTSNLFGSATYNLSKNINFDYDFSIDNDLKSFEKNTFGIDFSFLNDFNETPKFTTSFDFSESNGKMGDTNVLSNTTTYNFRKDNYLSFQTRRNRKLNFTEYYDLVYQYKNDCLVAGIKFKKTYYQDRDLKPQEDLLFTVTFFPITQYEQRVDQSIWE